MNAAMGVIQFKEYGRNREKRREIAATYTQAAQRTRHKRFVQPDLTIPEDQPVEGEGEEQDSAAAMGEYNNYTFSLILETGMKDVKAYAKKKDIEVESAFDHTLIAAGAVAPELCPEAYSLSLRTALFPLYPRLSATEVQKVAKLIMTLP
jgi:dTDP-4-amino-4,6-dideoxygalactose transaminase